VGGINGKRTIKFPADYTDIPKWARIDAQTASKLRTMAGDIAFSEHE